MYGLWVWIPNYPTCMLLWNLKQICQIVFCLRNHWDPFWTHFQLFCQRGRILCVLLQFCCLVFMKFFLDIRFLMIRTCYMRGQRVTNCCCIQWRQISTRPKSLDIIEFTVNFCHSFKGIHKIVCLSFSMNKCSTNFKWILSSVCFGCVYYF